MSSPRPCAPQLAPAGWLVAGLVLLCLVPRALMARKLDVLCQDGVLYIQLAKALDRGDMDEGLREVRLNTYPAVLALLHRLGLDWEVAGECWGVLISTLVVLPLFGWVRRQFDDRVALAACILYAIHPKLIEWSPEVIRDPTFWFCFILAVYWMWRAVTEVRLGFYAAAGVAIALALHTRFEGLFLFLPLLIWSGWRFRALVEGRGRMVAGVVLAVAMCPVLVLAVNMTWLGGRPRWELGNFNRVEYAVLWSRSVFEKMAKVRQFEPGPAPGDVPAGQPKPAPEAGLAAGGRPAPRPPLATHSAVRMSTGKTLWVFVHTLCRGMEAVFGLLWLFGLWRWRHVWLRRDHQAQGCVALCVLAGMWIHLWYAQETSSRYILSIVLLGSPCAALGWLGLCQMAVRFSQAYSRLTISHGAVFAATLLFFGAIGWIDALSSGYVGRQREAALGKWLLAEFGPGQRFVAPGRMALLGYYAQSSSEPLPSDTDAPSVIRLLATSRPDFAVISRKRIGPEMYEPLLAQARGLGFSRVSQKRLPPGYDWHELVVLERGRGDPPDRTASRRPPET